MLLSKSDFNVGRTCPTKLYYRKLGYPTTRDDDPYVQFLADGGYMVEAIARVLFTDGEEVKGESQDDRVEETRKALERNKVVLFQATLRHEKLVAEIDILEKRGNRFKLVEVKAKSVKPGEGGLSPFRGKKGKIFAEWKPYLEDVAFQTHILQCSYPNAKITPCLCLVDKTQTSNGETAFENFHIEPRAQDADGGFRKPEITFTGDLGALRKESFVRIFDVTAEVAELSREVKDEAEKLAHSIAGKKPTRIEPALSVVCKSCEYRTSSNEQNGFRECWEELADASPHFLDLYYVGDLKDDLIAAMVEQRKAHLVDLPPAGFKGKRGIRQNLQYERTRKNEEFIDPKLLQTLKARKYPLHFLDFEASRLAVPYHAGMHPYGQVAFQWSCHTIPKRGAEIEHRDWINVDNSYPNFEFGKSLKEVVTGEGTVFVWSPFERSALKDIQGQMATRKERDKALSAWLTLMIDKKGPIVDLCELAKDYYFHPYMKGSLSIKKVLPAVWFNNEKLRKHPWFVKYLGEENGEVLEPYKTLPSLPFGDDDSAEDAEAVREGTGAIRTYQEMMFGKRRDDAEFRDTMRQLLLNYCELDTAAMVMIWMHWTGAYEA